MGTEEGAVHKCSKAYSSEYLSNYAVRCCSSTSREGAYGGWGWCLPFGLWAVDCVELCPLWAGIGWVCAALPGTLRYILCAMLLECNTAHAHEHSNHT